MKTVIHTTLGLAGLALAIGIGGTACKEAQAKVTGVGDSLQAFIITNCESGERYCQVCAYGGKPTIMAVGDIDDEGFRKDLMKIQTLVDNHKDQSLSAFALYGKFTNGKFEPLADEKAATAKLAALQKELGLTYPVTMVPKSLTAKEKKDYTPFTTAYDIKASRTVMFAGANNKILWADTLGKSDAQYDQLAEAIKKAL